METHRNYCERHAKAFCESRDNIAILERELGWGQEGFVWETERGSAIKVYRPDAQLNFNRELRAYTILSHSNISNIAGFEVPELLDHDQLLQVIEITLVEPPYILDFGKVYFEDRRPDFSPEVMEDYDEQREEWFEGNWGRVQSALDQLESLGIYYNDARPGNINCLGLKDIY